MEGFEEILARYGQDMTVEYRDGRPDRVARALLQPILERREDWRQELPTPLGVMRQDRYLYFGAPEVSLEGCRFLTHKGQKLRVQSAQLISIGGVDSHWWAVAEA